VGKNIGAAAVELSAIPLKFGGQRVEEQPRFNVQPKKIYRVFAPALRAPGATAWAWGRSGTRRQIFLFPLYLSLRSAASAFLTKEKEERERRPDSAVGMPSVGTALRAFRARFRVSWRKTLAAVPSFSAEPDGAESRRYLSERASSFIAFSML
jgi:hypothetical protein